MTYAVATIVQQIRHMLRDTPQVDVLTGSYTAAGVSLTVADATKYDVGDELEFADGDTFVVTAASGTTITTVAGLLSWQGSTNANHSSGAFFFLKPAYRYVQIIEAIDATIGEMWPYAWKATTDTITPVAGTYYYDAATSTTTAMDIIDAVQRDAGGLRVNRYGGSRDNLPIALERGLPTAIAASTVGYYFPQLYNLTYTIACRVRAKITNTLSTTNYTDLTSGSMVDAIVFGAAARLVENTEIPRVTQADVTMGDATVQPGQRVRDGAYYRERFLLHRELIRRELEVTIPRQPKQR